MSETEREFLTQSLKEIKSRAHRWIEGCKNALITWSVLMVLFLLAWKLIAWVAGRVLHVEIGFQNLAALWVVAFAALSIAVYAVVSSVRWVKSCRDVRPDILADLKANEVIEETYLFTAAKRFQEPEHGGLFYFLRTPDDKVFVIFDEESQNLGAEDENPLSSKFQPCEQLVIGRAPITNWALSQKFFGAALDAGEPLEMSVPPERWPESEAFCKFRWDDLDKKLSKKRKRK